MEIDQRERDGILILGLAGQLTSECGNLAFRGFFRVASLREAIKIILYCSRLRKIDSAGLDTLVYFQRRAPAGGWKSRFDWR
jgi:hypothetical protein